MLIGPCGIAVQHPFREGSRILDPDASVAVIAAGADEESPFSRAMHLHFVMVGKDKLGQAERVARSRFLPNLQLLVFQAFQELGIYFFGRDYLSMVINNFIFVLVQIRLVLTYCRN